jgi:hypothetical protein
MNLKVTTGTAFTPSNGRKSEISLSTHVAFLFDSLHRRAAMVRRSISKVSEADLGKKCAHERMNCAVVRVRVCEDVNGQCATVSVTGAVDTQKQKYR